MGGEGKCAKLCGVPFAIKCGANIPTEALWGVAGVSLHPEMMPSRAVLHEPELLALTLANGGQVNCAAANSELLQSQCSGYEPIDTGAGE